MATKAAHATARRWRKYPWTDEQQRAFFATIAETGNASAACRAIGYPIHAHHWRMNEPAFKRAFEHAIGCYRETRAGLGMGAAAQGASGAQTVATCGTGGAGAGGPVFAGLAGVDMATLAVAVAAALETRMAVEPSAASPDPREALLARLEMVRLRLAAARAEAGDGDAGAGRPNV